MTETIVRLPAPTQEDWEWQYEGACRDADPNVFFHPEGERGSARRRRAEAAKRYCFQVAAVYSITRLAYTAPVCTT